MTTVPLAVRSEKARDAGCTGSSKVAVAVESTGTVEAPEAGVVEDTLGGAVSTKVVSNTTGADALATIAAREVTAAKFAPPVRNCVTRAFLFTYRRAF